MARWIPAPLAILEILLGTLPGTLIGVWIGPDVLGRAATEPGATCPTAGTPGTFRAGSGP
ncbi:hypothetical protein ACFY0G_21915 [Streptomyces sp. NPDC001552]|uniref:hypothetical protein n=1 Tax=Streptomyces sp. NPDC001552 TaxID=3364587 RepID=UPI0036BDF125